jgi:phosphate starvation-inducible membrane PsiE
MQKHQCIGLLKILSLGSITNVNHSPWLFSIWSPISLLEALKVAIIVLLVCFFLYRMNNQVVINTHASTKTTSKGQDTPLTWKEGTLWGSITKVELILKLENMLRFFWYFDRITLLGKSNSSWWHFTSK